MNEAHTQRINAYLLGPISAEQIQDLESWLQEDEQNVRLYLQEAIIHQALRQVLVQQLSLADTQNELTALAHGATDIEEWDSVNAPDSGRGLPDCDVARIKEYANRQLTEFLEEQHRADAELRRQRTSIWDWIPLSDIWERVCLMVGNGFKLAKATALCASIVLVVWIGITSIKAYRVVGTLGPTVHAKWEKPPADTILHRGWMRLHEGMAEITLRKGSTVIVQAPSEFKLCSPKRLILTQGTITAEVPPGAPNLLIKTPKLDVIDFGTEFGLQVANQNQVEVHVFDGEVGLTPPTSPSDEAQTFIEGQAAVMDETGRIQQHSLEDRPRLFMRQLPDENQPSIPGKSVDLADIFGGGSGFGTARTNRYTDPTTGRIADRHTYQRRSGSEAYVELLTLPVVDGVFVPPAAGGAFPISSTGVTFAFPPTSGYWWTEISFSGLVLTGTMSPNPEKPMLGGRFYGDQQSIVLHANLGVTFDLDAVRKTLGPLRIVSFKAKCGIHDNVTFPNANAELYVLVDGNTRFRKTLYRGQIPAEDVLVVLSDRDRFLTLACTEDRDANGDWGLFAEPVLQLQARPNH